MAAPQLLTRAQVAARLGVSYTTVKNAVTNKRLRETRIPSARGVRSIPRYAERDVEAYIAAGYRAGLR